MVRRRPLGRAARHRDGRARAPRAATCPSDSPRRAARCSRRSPPPGSCTGSPGRTTRSEPPRRWPCFGSCATRTWSRRPSAGERLRAALARRAPPTVPSWATCGASGTMIGIELVRDRDTKEPFPRSQRVTERVVAAARDDGLLLYSSTGHVDGTNGDLIMLGPPFVLTDEDEAHPRRAHRGCDTFGRVSGTAGLVHAPEAGSTTTAPAIRCARTRAADVGPDRRPTVCRPTPQRPHASALDPADDDHARARAHPGVHRRHATSRRRRGRAVGPVRLRPRRQPRSSIGCTRPGRSWRGATRGGGAGRALRARSRTRSTLPAACTTRCRRERRGSACTTTRRSPSPGCSARASERIAYVDVDVHHGDGAQAIFYDDPRVLTISIHEYAPHIGFFPGPAGRARRGGPRRPARRSTCRSTPAPATTAGWKPSARVVAAAVTRFAPDVLVTQLGCDTHASDPLAHLRLTTATYRATARDPARAGARGRRRPLGGDRRRRVPVGARGAACLDDRTSPRWRASSCPTSCRGWVERAASSVAGAPVPTTLVGAAPRGGTAR